MKKDKVRKFTVLVADAEPMARSALVQLITSHPGYALVGEAESALQARALAVRLKPEVVVLDLGLGESLVLELKGLAHGPALMVVGRRLGLLAVRRLLSAGAVSVVGRGDDAGTYEEALVLATVGRRFLGPQVEARLVDELAMGPVSQGEPKGGGLSAREREIFALLGEGLGTRAVAGRLGVSVKTIETHQGRMKAKLGVASSGELARRALLAAAEG